MPDRRADFVRTVGNGRAVSVARDKGYELIDKLRLSDLIADLVSEGLIQIPDNVDNAEDAYLDIAERGIEILHG